MAITMKSVLAILLLTVTINCFSQLNPGDTLEIKPSSAVTIPVNKKSVMDLNLAVANSPTAKNHSDSLKLCFGQTSGAAILANTANTNAQSAITTNTQQAVQLANQALQITAAANVASAAQVTATIAASRLDSLIRNIPVGVVKPPTNIITNNYTLQLSDWGKIIEAQKGLTISCPVLQSGFYCFIVRNTTSSVYVDPSGVVKRTGATQIAARQGGQWLTYSSSVNCNLQVR